MKYLLGVDLGTSSTKTVLFDEMGTRVASATVEYPLYQPQNGWAEQDPKDWYEATIKTIKAVLEDSGVNATDVLSLGIAGQMHGLVLLDAEGEVLRNSIIWCDGRTQKQCDEITETIGRKQLIEITANPALTGFTLGKILWVRENEKEIFERAKTVLLPKDYVRYKLTGKLNMEVSDASGMNLLNISTRQWSDEIIEKLDLDRTLFPEICESAEVVGTITKEISEITGLSQETQVVGGAGDNAAAAIGMGVCAKGRAFTTIGTSGVVFAHSDEVTVDKDGRVHTFCAATKGGYTVMSCTLAAGLSLKWTRDNLCEEEMQEAQETGEDVYNIMTNKAMESPIGANRLLYLPYLMGERSPILDSDARGAFLGLSGMHEKKDMIRSVMEGVMYSQRHCLDVLREMGVAPTTMLACGGGGKSPFWRQMMADIFSCPVKTAAVDEGPALGVAILAGVGAGVWQDVKTACDNVLVYNPAIEAIVENTVEYEKFYELYREGYPSLQKLYSKLANM